MADVEIERLRARVAELEELRTGVQLVMGLGSETDNESLLAAVARVYERADAAESLAATESSRTPTVWRFQGGHAAHTSGEQEPIDE